MAAKRNIEELRDMLDILFTDAPDLARYGHLAGSEDLFLSLSECDRRRLLALALTLGCQETQSVASALMSRLKPEPGTFRELLDQMDPADIAEIRAVSASVKMPKQLQLTRDDYARIREEVQAACEDFGSNIQEQAYWILIPHNQDEDADWLEAVGGDHNLFNFVGSTVEVEYDPGRQELYQLLSDMQQARWVLHIHNHPNHSSLGFSMPGLYFPSQHDLDFAYYWKSLRPETGTRMLFFLISGNVAVQYALPHYKIYQWLP